MAKSLYYFSCFESPEGTFGMEKHVKILLSPILHLLCLKAENKPFSGSTADLSVNIVRFSVL